ncbi:DUF3303 domain-containing protein [Gemmatimonadota bacterium]
MLFYVGWKIREGQGADELEASWDLFSRWEAPDGLEFKGMWSRADGGGFCVCEASSAEVLYEATAPWAGAYLDYEFAPIVEMEKGHALSAKAAAFRKG